MTYHLNRNGHNLGVFPLEELHRRRVAGELTGTEIVWCEGMVQWQSLDLVLKQKLPGALRPVRPPPVQPSTKTNPVLLVVVGVLLLVFLCGLVFLGIAAMKYSHRIGRVFNEINRAAKTGSAQSSAVALASQPVTWKSNTLTTAETTVINREFRVRQYLDGYKLRGERDTTADDLSLGLLENWIAGNYGGTMRTNLPPLSELSDRLAADPACTDPLVLALTAINSEGLYEKGRRLERAVKGFEKSKHLAYPKFFATVSLADNLVELRTEPGRVRVLDAQALRHLREALDDGSILPEDQETLGEIMLLNYGRRFFNRNAESVASLVQDHGKKFQWLALVLEGKFEVSEAWRVRGSGYANKVTTEGWQGFSDHLALAEKHLSQAWHLQPRRPLAPSAMIEVALGNGSLADMRLWFDRTLDAQVDFEDAWSEMRWGLRSRWYGNQAAMLALGVTALNTRHFETTVPRKFFDSLSDVEEELELPAGTHIYGRADIWPHLREMYEGYLAQPDSDPANQDDWHSHYAVVAYLAGKYDVAGQQLQAINWQPEANNLINWGTDLSLLPQEVAARTGDQASAITAAEASRNAGDLVSARQQYRTLAALTNLAPMTQSFVHERQAALELESRLQTHDWVDFLPTETNATGFTGWQVERGRCTLKPDGALDVYSGENGHLLYSRARLGWDFEVRGQMEVERSSSQSFQGGLVMGLPQFGSYNWYSFRLKRNREEGDVVTFGRHWSKKEITQKLPLDKFTNSFYFRFQDGKVSATVNQQEVFKDAQPAWDISVATNEFLLGLGAFNDANDTVIRYRNVQTRSLAPASGFQLTAPLQGK